MILCTGSLKISSRGAHVKEFVQKDAVVKRTRLNCCTVITCKSCQCNTQLLQEPGSEVEDCEVSSDSDNFDDPVTSADSDTEVSSDSETSCSSIDDMVQNDDFDFVSEGEL